MSAPYRHCLLVVDDEPDICDSVRDLLRRQFNVLTATSGEEGLRLLQENDVHIVMTDQRMPRTSGVELLTRARATSPRTVRMLFTGFTEVESIIAAINQGHVYRYLRKPWDPDDLEAAVRDAASEYERQSKQGDENLRLRSEVDDLRRRVAALEAGAGHTP